MTISDALPVQFWINGVATFNEAEEAGIEHTDFCQPFNADDEIKIQFTDEEGLLFNLNIYDSDDMLIGSIYFDEVEAGVYEATLVPEDESDLIFDKVVLKIEQYTVDAPQGGSLGNFNWQSVAYGNGLFVAIGQTAGTNIKTSPTGIGVTWTSRTASSNNNWTDITFGNGLFVAVSSNGTNRVMTSPDGITWTGISVPSFQWLGVHYANGRFVAVGTSGHVMYSDDGSTWISATTPNSINFRSVSYGDGVWIAVGGNVSTNAVIRSIDNGVTWTEVVLDLSHTFNDVVFGLDLFVAVSAQSRVMTSPDGITWTLQSSPSIAGKSISFSQGVFIYVEGTGDEYALSVDAVNWILRDDLPSENWNGITYGNDSFVLVSESALSSGTAQVLLVEVTIPAQSDFLDIQDDHVDSRLITYTNNHDFADIQYDGDYPPTFHIRVLSKFYEPRLPQEDESESLSSGTIVKLSGTVKSQKLLEVEPVPPYMHEKLVLILAHNSLYINNLSWTKEDNYEIGKLDDKFAFFGGKVWLTKSSNNFISNVN